MFVVRDGGESKNDGISPLAFEISWNITHGSEENTIVETILCRTFQALVGGTVSLLEKASIYRSTPT